MKVCENLELTCESNTFYVNPCVTLCKHFLFMYFYMRKGKRPMDSDCEGGSQMNECVVAFRRLSSLHSDWRPQLRRASFANPTRRADGWRRVWVPGCPGCHEVPSCPPHCAGWVRLEHTRKQHHLHSVRCKATHGGFAAVTGFSHSHVFSLLVWWQSGIDATELAPIVLNVRYLIIHQNERSTSSVLLSFGTIPWSMCRCPVGEEAGKVAHMHHPK